MSTSSGGMFYVPYAVCSAPLTELYASCDFGISLKIAEDPVSPFHSALQQPLGTVPLQRWKGQPSWLRMKLFFNAWMAIEGQWERDSISKRFVISPQTIVCRRPPWHPSCTTSYQPPTHSHPAETCWLRQRWCNVVNNLKLFCNWIVSWHKLVLEVETEGTQHFPECLVS